MLHVSQPGHGFRAGLDSVLLGAAPAERSASLLDLGAGVGTAALVGLAQDADRTATLVERDLDLAGLAALNLRQNGFAARARVLTLDVTEKGRARAAAGLAADHFDAVIANPPFFDPAGGTAPAPARAGARHMPPAELELWVKTAASHAAPGGEVIFIHAAAALPALLQAFLPRFGGVTVLPFTPRPFEAASRVLIRGIKGSRAPFVLLASRPLHLPESRGFQPDFEALFRGEGRLVW